MSNHARFDYSGGEFGRPSPKFLSQSWRLQHNFLGKASRAVSALNASSVLFGQDSVGVSALSPGLAVYAGYNYGTFDNWNALVRRFGGSARLVSITPVVQGLTKCRVLDVEPGDARPQDTPAFQRQGEQVPGQKPMYYTSAGDLQAVINALSAAGYARSEYYLWSAHWTGLHICGPRTCGYPQADATQYASNNAFDSDVFNAYVFGNQPPVSPWPLKLGSTGTLVTTLQEVLNKLAAKIKLAVPLAVDGSFGAKTRAAVVLAQAALGKPATLQEGEVSASYLTGLEHNANPRPPLPVAPLNVTEDKIVVKRYKLKINRTIPGYKGKYTTTVRSLKWSFTAAPEHGEIEVEVPGPGVYEVTTSAPGWAATTVQVSVAP